MLLMKYGDYKSSMRYLVINLKIKKMNTQEEKSALDKLSLSEAETLLEQEMDELVGGGDDICYCTSGAKAS